MIRTASPLFLTGVNLGGWLVLEKWMTPTVFMGTDAVDEYTFMQTPYAAEKIERHRRQFMTQDDFAWLAKNGVNAVRIPVGYWLFDGDAPYTPAVRYLDWAMKMANAYKLKVLIDLHGAKGSQNGRDHSGRIGRSDWYKSASNRKQTIEVLEKIAKRYRDEPSLWGIELLNEPKFGLFHFKLRHFHHQAYQRLVRIVRPGTVIVFHDAFTPRLMNGSLPAANKYPVMMDIHWYQFASIWQRWQKLVGYFAKVRRRSGLIYRLQRLQPVIIGEWSVVLSEQILKGFSKKQRAEAFARHGELQLQTYSTAAGWFYWTYKTEGRGIWHFRSLIEDGVIILK